MEAVNLDVMLPRFAEHWSPKKIAQVNDYDVWIVKIQGEAAGVQTVAASVFSPRTSAVLPSALFESLSA